VLRRDRGQAGAGRETLTKRCLVCGDDRIRFRLKQAPTIVLQCDNCGLVFVDPLPGETELRALYLDYDLGEADPAFASLLASRRKSRAPVFQEVLKELIAHGARGRLLDVGCSFGFLLSLAKERGLEPTGVDLSLNAVRYVGDRLRLPAHHGTLFDAKLPDGAFDVVTMVGVFEHVPDPLETLREIARILRPGGLLAVEVPNAHFNLLRGRLHASWFYIGNHLLNFTPQALVTSLEAAGFRCAKLWCGKADRPGGWVFNVAKSSVVTAARFVARAFRWYWGPSLVALAVKV
jgi:SAM-dependent methyltransferase